ncbi:3-methyl-2-oxobutanoate dehydrogenase subunit beta [Thermosphaera aggregans]|jgi:pyruvate ferredoxin oxidoreductase beta subunit|uniref:2-oxoacid oxidoreductase (ferredoxin) n=1 Tax=Thermosphaera aggregans (strain DSM 11486 / M11TL) TaxID=633148 RepID=D5U1U9_THEAM|nr:3-methyl-2-oxobutanoate dehydrogenase subunit beta [Thermosphaera aggregans]ADG91099.1 thiamine pyrophosphate protein domain protein TPP-binding protein [Thermosphaera aggregans DSM 11486]
MSQPRPKQPIPYNMRDAFLPGDAACSGCPIPMGWKTVHAALGGKVIYVIPACCSSVVVGTSPGHSLNATVVHVPFAAAASVASGIAEALEKRGITDVHVVAWAGDGGTADIGLATLSGAAERNNNMIYIMYDNEAYMNTGIQRSSSTPRGAWTTTTPVAGKAEQKKDVAKIMIAHNIPYVATASIAYPHDFYSKLQRAKSIKGFKFIHLHAPCPVGWRFEPQYTVKMARLAVETGLWVLYEYQNGKITLSGPSRPYMDPSKRKPIEEYIKMQGRFRNITQEILEEIRKSVELNWEWIRKFM